MQQSHSKHKPQSLVIAGAETEPDAQALRAYSGATVGDTADLSAAESTKSAAQLSAEALEYSVSASEPVTGAAGSSTPAAAPSSGLPKGDAKAQEEAAKAGTATSGEEMPAVTALETATDLHQSDFVLNQTAHPQSKPI